MNHTNFRTGPDQKIQLQHSHQLEIELAYYSWEQTTTSRSNFSSRSWKDPPFWQGRLDAMINFSHKRGLNKNPLSDLRFYRSYVNDVSYPCQGDNFSEVYFFSGLILQASFSNNSVPSVKYLQTRFQVANRYIDGAMNNHPASRRHQRDEVCSDFDGLR